MFSSQIHDSIKESSSELKSAIKDLSTETNRVLVSNWLNSDVVDISGVSELKFNLAYKNDNPFLLFRFNNMSKEVCKGGLKVSSNIENDLNTLLNAIYKGEKAIAYINTRLDDIRSRNGIILGIKYRWGYGEHAHVLNWDYNNIVIGLSKDVVNALSFPDDETMRLYVDKIMDTITWEFNIAEFIHNFNDFSLNKDLNLKLKYTSVVDNMLDNMLLYEDIHSEVIKNIGNNSTGVQTFKTVDIIKELGIFGAIVKWTIDYKDREAIAMITDDKVIDIENLRFVSDHSLYSRIEQRVLDDAKKLSQEMISMTS